MTRTEKLGTGESELKKEEIDEVEDLTAHPEPDSLRPGQHGIEFAQNVEIVPDEAAEYMQLVVHGTLSRV